MKSLEKILKVFANHRRLLILTLLVKNKEMNVANIAGNLKLSFKSTSKHLSQLLSLDIVGKDQRGLFMYYNISKKHLPLVKFILSYIPYSRE